MVNTDYVKLLLKRVDQLLSDGILQNKEVFLLPADEYAIEIIEYLRKYQITITAVLDDCTELVGQTVAGVSIKTVEECLSPFHKDTQVVLATSYNDTTLIRKIDFIECWHNVNRYLLSEIVPQKQKKVLQLCKGLKDRLRSRAIVRLLYERKNVILASGIIKKVQTATRNAKIFLFPHRSIGDIYILGTYLYQGAEKFSGDFVLVVVGNACKTVAEMAGFKNVIAVTQKEMDRLLKMKLFLGNSCENIEILHYDYMGCNIVNPIIAENKFTFFECYQYLVFGEKCYYKNDKFGRYDKDITEYCKKNGLHRGKTVIIAPYCKSIQDITPIFWETLVKDLKKAGYTVVTNCGNAEERAIFGTTPLNIPLKELRPIVEYCGYFISIRSGFCDLISDFNAKKIVLFPDLELPVGHASYFYSFQDADLNQPVEEIDCKSVPDVKKMSHAVMKLMETEINKK